MNNAMTITPQKFSAPAYVTDRLKSVPLSDVVFRLSDSGLARAIGAAIERVLGLDAMPDDPAAALSADRGQLLDRAFEAVEDMLPARRDHLEGQIIIVAANFTLSHVHTSCGKFLEVE